ncbi:MAG: hypothetical protein U0326_38340 [Polyangiales bacterium]
MKLRSASGVATVACAGALAWWTLRAPEAPADPRREVAPPPVVLLEGAPDGTETRVVLRATSTGAQPRVLGAVTHIAGSARRGTLSRTASRTSVYVVAAERESRHGSTYESALWLVEDGSPPRRLVGGVTDASRAAVTARGAVVVQRGRDGEDPALVDHVLRERVDALTLDVVDPANGAARTVWSGRGMIAFLAAAMQGDEVLVYHVHEGGAALFALDVVSGSTRPLIAQMDALARDFSYDAVHDEVAFVRASQRREGTWEVVTLPAHGPARSPESLQTRWRATSDHLMPRMLRDGAIVISLPDDRGLGVLRAFPQMPERVAPLGDGADEALGESDDGRWLALRHRAPNREVLGLYDRVSHRSIEVDRPEVYTEFVGFTRAVSP